MRKNAAASSRNDLTNGPIWRKMIGFFMPIWIGLLFQQLYNTVDAIVVGRYLGAGALAAVGGSAAAITNLVIGFFTGLNGGASVLIAQKFGADDREGLSNTLHTSLVFSTVIGLVITVAGYIFTPWMLRVVNNPADIMEDSILYLRIYYTGSIPLLLYSLAQGTLQAVGDSRTPLRYLIISCLLNIALDVTFVALLDWGVAGVGWASVISMAVCTALVIRHLMRTDGPHRLRPAKLRIHRDALKKMLRIGVPSGVQGSMYGISNLVIQAAVNGFGTTVVAAWTATGKLDGLYWVTSTAIGSTVCSFIGQCWGAGKIRRMKKSVKIFQTFALSVTVFLSTLLLAIARPVFGLFMDDAAVIDAAVEIMWYFVPFYFIWSFVDVLSGTFRGVGDTLRPTITIILCNCVLRVVWMFTVVPAWHCIASVSIIYAISWAMCAITFIIYYARGNWRHHGTPLGILADGETDG